uniref:Thioredoxin domain-containing protein n=1 Tax=Trichobilharzia regenti TaxID=157069 RepID=A0AA85IVU1_TRIRE|nr:unnamed protein product [Trichobilharzia regenti]
MAFGFLRGIPHSVTISLNLLLCLLTDLSVQVTCEVFELDNRFIDFIDKGPWLVQFYAPWCGFCRRLTSTYEEMSRLLIHMEPSIKVARLDATVYTGIAKMFDIRGFPTIKYINSTVTYTFMGDRTVKGLITFAQRANGKSFAVFRFYRPAVKHFEEKHKFEERIKQLDSDEPFFFLLTSTNSVLKVTFLEVAEKLRIFSWFFSGSLSVLPQPYIELLKSFRNVFTEILVFKDSNVYSYPGLLSSENQQITTNKSELYQDLLLWVLRERQSDFPKLSTSDLWEFASSGLGNINFNLDNMHNNSNSILSPYPVSSNVNSIRVYRNYRLIGLFTVDQLLVEDSFPSRVLKFGQTLALRRLPHIIRYFQLAWTDDIEALEDLAMGVISTPNFIVVDPLTRELFMYLSNHYSSHSLLLDESNLINFLMLVNDGKVKAVGGNTISVRLQRLGYNFVTGVIKFLITRPFMAMLVFGVPIIMLSGIIYLCCCLDTDYANYGDDYNDNEEACDKQLSGRKVNKNINDSTDSIIDTDSSYVTTNDHQAGINVRSRNIKTFSSSSNHRYRALHPGRKILNMGPVYSEEELRKRIKDCRAKKEK